MASLEGLQHLKMLEKLNLYYNNIGSMKELERLGHNKQLVELDLRLNPVTKEENDYRLFLIRLLPALRVLDDRPIKDTERKMANDAAALHHEQQQQQQQQQQPHSSRFSSASMSGLDWKHHGVVRSNSMNGNSASASRIKSVANIVRRSAGKLPLIFLPLTSPCMSAKSELIFVE